MPYDHIQHAHESKLLDTLCVFRQKQAKTFVCDKCHETWTATTKDEAPPLRLCVGARNLLDIRHAANRMRRKGPGDFLHDAILRWVGEGPTRECGCTDRIVKMNAWGAAGCREHIDEIVAWLVEEATKRGWWSLAVAVPGSRFFIKRMVLSAIKKAEREADTDTHAHLTGVVVTTGLGVASDAMEAK